MGYALIWIEGLAAMLLLTAVSASYSAHRQRRWGQLVLPLLAMLPVALLAAALTWVTAILKFHYHGLIPHDWFVYTFAWTIAFLAGATVLFSRGLRRTGAEPIPPVQTWPRGRLALALAGMMVLLAITLSNMDLAMKVRLAETRIEAGAVLLAMKPSSVADKDNAASLYKEVFAALPPLERLSPRWKMENNKENQTDNWDLPGPFVDQYDWRDKQWKEFLHGQERTLTLLRKAASKPACHFADDDLSAWLEGASLHYPPNFWQPFSQASRLLSLDARVRAAAGDTHRAVEDIAAILAMARHDSNLRVEKEGWDTLADVLHLSLPSPEQLATLSRVEGEAYLRRFPRTQAGYALRILVMLSPEGESYRSWDMTRELPFLHRRGQPKPEGYDTPFWFEATIGPVWRVYLAPDDLLFIHRSLKECRESLQARNGPSSAIGKNCSKRWRVNPAAHGT